MIILLNGSSSREEHNPKVQPLLWGDQVGGVYVCRAICPRIYCIRRKCMFDGFLMVLVMCAYLPSVRVVIVPYLGVCSSLRCFGPPARRKLSNKSRMPV